MHPSLQCLTSGPLTILAYGALLSERSAQLTFPKLRNFRLARVQGYRRVFAHPHFFLISQGIVDPTSSKRIASLSAERCDGSPGFVVGAFDVDMDDELREEFQRREPEYSFESVPFTELDGMKKDGQGILCTRPDDGDEGMRSGLVIPPSLSTVWGYKPDAQLLPADIYLRHVVLSSERAGDKAKDSFLDETLLCDRETPLRTYLKNHPEVMKVMPPEHLKQRFSG